MLFSIYTSYLYFQKLQVAGGGITYQKAHGAMEEGSIIYSIIKRNDLSKVDEIIRKSLPLKIQKVERSLLGYDNNRT